MRHHDDPACQTATPDLDLRQLVARAAAGDTDAFGELYDATCGLVHGMVARMLPDAEVAERVTESAYLRAFAGIATSAGERVGILPWLLDLAHTEALVEIRRESPEARQDRILAALAADEATDPPPTGLWSAMGKLTGSQRRSLHLAYFGGFEHADVDSALGLPSGASSVRMSDGLRALRDHLEAAGIMEPVSA